MSPVRSGRVSHVNATAPSTESTPTPAENTNTARQCTSSINQPPTAGVNIGKTAIARVKDASTRVMRSNG